MAAGLWVPVCHRDAEAAVRPGDEALIHFRSVDIRPADRAGGTRIVAGAAVSPVRPKDVLAVDCEESNFTVKAGDEVRVHIGPVGLRAPDPGAAVGREINVRTM